MNIFYYVTSHGYGHGVRTCTIADALPPDYKITFRTTLPEHFFREEVKRDFRYIPGEFDCGCLQSDGVTTNVIATLKHYEQIALRNNNIIENEIALCREMNVDGIISDITPFAFEIADRCSIPSVAISNFSWYDIYNEYASEHPEYKSLIDNTRLQYEKAGMLLALYPSLPMSYFRKRIDTGLIGRKGRNLRSELISKYNLDPAKKTGLIYVGNFGMHTAHWERLEEFTEWQFIGVYPLSCSPSNFCLVSKDHFRYQDLISSSDAMISKLGYGSVSESMLNGKPIIYLPRTQFAEYPVLEKAVCNWGGGVKLETESFYELRWHEALERAAEIQIDQINSTGVNSVVESVRNFFGR